MRKYIIKNCPCYDYGFCTSKTIFVAGCSQCTNCLLKQIVEKCENEYVMFEGKEFIDDTLQCFNFSAGIITFFDKDDSDKVFMPIFDFQVGLSFGTPYVLGWYSQYLGGISFRPIPFFSVNLATGLKLTGAWHTFEFVIIPDTYWLDGIIDANISLNLISFGLRTGIFMNIGTSGFGLFPFLSITFDKFD